MRLFIASRFSAATGERVSELRTCAATGSGGVMKWVEPENLHLTYAFLGEVPGDRSGVICGRIDAVAASFGRIPVTIRGLGAFPSLERPRVLWLGLGAGGPELERLAFKLREELAAGGFVLERDFSAHITIARIKGRLPEAAMSEIAARAAKFEAAETVASLELIESRLSAAEPEYRTCYARELL